MLIDYSKHKLSVFFSPHYIVSFVYIISNVKSALIKRTVVLFFIQVKIVQLFLFILGACVDKGSNTKLRILEEAVGFVAQHGFAQISIGKIASRMSMSRTGVISHFANKADMQIAILRHCEQVFKSQVIMPSVSSDPLQHLLNYFQNWKNWVFKYKNQPKMTCPFVKAISEFQDRDDCKVRRCIVDQQKRNLRFIASLVQKNADAGIFSADVDPQHFSLTSYGYYLSHNINRNLIGSENADEVFMTQISTLIQYSLVEE